MWEYNSKVWEWMHLGQYDLLLAHRDVLDHRAFQEFYWESIRIAWKGVEWGKLQPSDQPETHHLIEARLRDHFKEALAAAFIEDPRANDLFEPLLASYREPGRAYHTDKHLLDVLNVIWIHKEKARNLGPVLLAAWYHDSVYDPAKNDNQARSAERARRELLSAEVSEIAVREIESLILMTRNHRAASSADEKLLADADCAIWAQNKTKYRRYAQAIRQEHAAQSWLLYGLGRRKFLKNQLSEEGNLFSFLDNEVSQRARANLQQELSRLSLPNILRAKFTDFDPIQGL
jgi:predicted metal-dependent HD superfamily phosphohydrolase